MVRTLPKIYIALAWILLIVGAIITLSFLALNNANYEIGKDFDYDKTGQFGDYIGGVVGTVFALAGTILVFASFVQQQHRNTIESFEKNYFEMLRVHEDIVSEMAYEDKTSRDVFPLALEHLREYYTSALEELNLIKNLLETGELEEETDLPALIQFYKDRDLEVVAMFLSMGVLYYGTEKFSLSLKEGDPLRVISKKVAANIPNYGYEPMGNILGHYYRQMYQTVNYVLKTKWLNEDERYDYVKLLRAQLSDYEQMMLYYNSMSVNGCSWRDAQSHTEIEKMSLIGRFCLIKNIPYHYDYFFRHPSKMYEEEKKAWKAKGKVFFENEVYVM